MKDSAVAFCVGVGLVLGVWLFSTLATKTATFDPEAAGLGRNTITRSAEIAGRRVAGLRVSEIEHAAHAFRNEGRSTALILGASQLHAINRFRTGDELAVFHANHRAEARRSNLRYVQVSIPNANFKEFLAIYLGLKRRGFTPDWLVITAVYDDLRETAIRHSVIKDMGEVPADLMEHGGNAIESLATEYRKTIANVEAGHSATGQVSNTGTPQARAESAIVRFLEDHWGAYRNRGKLKAAAQVNVKGLVSGLLGGSMARRAPPIPPDVAHENMTALDDLIALARADGSKILLYQPPHRPGEQVFYHDRTAYDAWFAELSTRTLQEEGLDFVNLETLVPQDLWGETNEGRPDVFHFQGEAHRLLGVALDQYFERAGL